MFRKIWVGDLYHFAPILAIVTFAASIRYDCSLSLRVQAGLAALWGFWALCQRLYHLKNY